MSITDNREITTQDSGIPDIRRVSTEQTEGMLRLLYTPRETTCHVIS